MIEVIILKFTHDIILFSNLKGFCFLKFSWLYIHLIMGAVGCSSIQLGV